VLGFGGLAMRANSLAIERLREAQDELARQAVADERRRVAREVHDTVAHTLSVTMLHLTAARMAVERAPDRAAAALEEAERQGRAGMGDIRRIVRLLRTDDEDPAVVRVADLGARPGLTIERALPTVGELPELLACYEAAGLTVTFACTGVPHAGTGDGDGDDDRDDRSRADNGAGSADGAGPRLAATVEAVPPGVGLALFRVAQESLANAAKHGCGDAEVRLCVGDDAVALTVRNRCRDDAVLRPGMGLIGMRERVVGLGGDFRAGPAADDGRTASRSADGSSAWEVTARIPTGDRL
jgi:signal transduction histidine kinase